METWKPVYGVYMHSKTAKLALVTKPTSESKYKWALYEIDKGISRLHPFLRVGQSIVEVGTGEYFYKRGLKGYELLEAFDNEVPNEP